MWFAPGDMADTKTASKKSAKKSGPSKAEFVRAQPRTMPAKDVVDKAKAEGIALTDSYVYKLRSSKKPKAAGKAGKTAGKRRGRKPGSGSKTAFVLSLPLDLPAADVVKKAADKGIKISDKYVYTIRSSKRRRSAGANGAPATPRSPSRAVAVLAVRRRRSPRWPARSPAASSTPAASSRSSSVSPSRSAPPAPVSSSASSTSSSPASRSAECDLGDLRQIRGLAALDSPSHSKRHFLRHDRAGQSFPFDGLEGLRIALRLAT